MTQQSSLILYIQQHNFKYLTKEVKMKGSSSSIKKWEKWINIILTKLMIPM